MPWDEAPGEDSFSATGTSLASHAAEGASTPEVAEGASSSAEGKEANLPPEFQSQLDAYKKQLQADYTKNMQGLADEKKSLGEKAQAFERLLTDANYRQQFLKALGAQGGEAQQANQPAYMAPEHYEKLQEDTLLPVQSAAYQVVKETLSPILQQFMEYRGYIDEIRQHFAGGEWQTISSKYENSEQFVGKAKELFDKAGGAMTREQALFAVAGPNLKAPTTGTRKADNPVDTRQGATLYQNGATAASGRPTGKQKLSLADLLHQRLAGRG